PAPTCTLEIHARVEDKSAAYAGGRDLSEGVQAVDVHTWISEVRMIQHIDRIKPEFEIRRAITAQPEPFNHVHVETETTGALYGCRPHRSNLTRLRIPQNRLPIRSDDGFVAEGGVQAIGRRYSSNSRIGDLRVAVEVENTVRQLRNVADILWY